MSGAGKGKRGHLERAEGRGYCGRKLNTSESGRFTDENDVPTVCAVCLRGSMKANDYDHYHLDFRDGCWAVAWNKRRIVYGTGLMSFRRSCYHPGCDYLVNDHVMPALTSTGNFTTSANWYWGAWAA